MVVLLFLCFDEKDSKLNFPYFSKKKKNDIPNYKGPRSDDPVILLILYIQDDDMTLWHRENIHCTCRYEFFENEM